MQELIWSFDNFIGEKYDKNMLLMSYNPMMTIALTAEVLIRISTTRRRFLDTCKGMIEALLTLGMYYNRKIELIDYYERLIMERDFLGRTVLAIICACKF